MALTKLKSLVDYDVSNSSDSDVDNECELELHQTNAMDVEHKDNSDTEMSYDEKDLKSQQAYSSESEVAPRSIPLSNKPNGPPSIKKKKEGEENIKVQLPNPIQSMFDATQERWVDDPSHHEERIRSFPHLEGNWATHVYIPVPWDNRLFEFINACVQLLHPLPFHPMPELHASLSRTVTIRHHWIESLVDSLRSNLRQLKGCISDFSTVKLFTNDEKTRTFLSFELTTDDTYFPEYVEAVDKSLSEFKLPAYYENPSFHVSVAWCLGDVTKDISEEKTTQLKEMLAVFLAQNPDLSVLDIHQVCCKTGNKSFFIPLQHSDR